MTPLLFAACILTSSLALANATDRSIENLLEEADRALHNHKPAPTKPKKSPSPKPRTSRPVHPKTKASPGPSTEIKTEPQEASRLQPLRDPELERILRADQTARNVERKRLESKWSAGLLIGALRTSRYELSKDEDRFAVDDGQWLAGAAAQYVPVELWASTSPAGPSGEIVFGIGLYSGQLVTERYGIQHGRQRYLYLQLQGDAQLRTLWPLGNGFEALAAVGVGFDGVRQEGQGELDTVIDSAASEALSIGITKDINPNSRFVTGLSSRSRKLFGTGGLANLVVYVGLQLELGSQNRLGSLHHL